MEEINDTQRQDNNNDPEGNNEEEKVVITATDLQKQACKDFLATFPPIQIYPSPHDLCNAITELASQCKCSVSRDGRRIKCSRAMDRAKAKKRAEKEQAGMVKKSTKSHQVDCPLKISWNYTQWMANCDKTPNQMKKHIGLSDECKIVCVCAHHEEHCDLTCQELQVILRRGDFLSQLNWTTLHQW